MGTWRGAAPRALGGSRGSRTPGCVCADARAVVRRPSVEGCVGVSWALPAWGAGRACRVHLGACPPFIVPGVGGGLVLPRKNRQVRAFPQGRVTKCLASA